MTWHAVFVTPPAPGHVYPSLPLVEELVSRGHRVTYVTSLDMAADVRAAGASVAELEWQPDTSALTEGDFTVDTLLASLNEYLSAARLALPGIVARLRRDLPAVVCCDSVPLGPLLAGIFDVPLVSLVPNLATNEHVDPAQLVPGFDPSHAGLAAYGARVAELFAEHDVPPVHGAAGLTLVFVPREFQIAGDTFDETYRFVGPSVGRARAGEWDPPGDGPVLLVSLGTAFNNRPEFFRATVEAFAGTRWQVVMAIGEHADPDAVGPSPANVQLAARVPQPAVLHHASAFVSHAGMGSTMEALYYEVPVVAVPQVREQELNAARLQELGLGTHLLTRSPTPEQLREAVEQVSNDQGIRARLADMRDALRRAGGAAAGAEAIERHLDG